MSKKIINIFVLLLILSMPFTQAVSLGSVTAVGQDGANGFVRSQDELTVSANVNKFVVADSAELLSVLDIEGTSFDECTKNTDWFTCTLHLDTKGFAPSSQFTITLDVEPTESVKRYVFVDSDEPSITDVTITQISQNIQIKATLADTAGLSESCSGLASYKITIDSISKEGTIEGGCAFELEEVMDVSQLNGDYDVQIEVWDKLENRVEQFESITIDTAPPAIESITIRSQYSDDVKFKIAEPARVAVKVSEDVESVIIYLNEERVAATVFAEYFVSPSFSIPDTIEVRVEALDILGNKIEDTLSRSFTVDSASPTVEFLGTNTTYDDISYVSENSQYIARIRESGVGLQKNNVYLTVNSVEYKGTCEEDWVCSWSIPVGEQGTQTITLRGTDDVGNAFTAEADVTTDTVKPFGKVTSVQGVGTQGSYSIIIEGGRVLVTALVTDESPVFAWANFSSIKGSVSEPVECVDGICSINSGRVQEGGFTGFIDIHFEDVAGNVYSVTEDLIKVYQTANPDADADNFAASYELSPSSFETSVSQFTNQKAYMLFKPIGRFGDIISTSFIPGSCVSAANTSSRAYFQEVRDIQSDSDTESIVSFTLKAVPLPEEPMVLECEFSVSGLVDDTFVEAEIEKVLVTFGTYSMSMGTPQENIDKKIKDAMDKPLVNIADKLASFTKLIETAQQICNIARLFFSIYNMYEVVSGVQKGKGLALLTNPLTAFAGEAIDKSGSLACVSNFAVQTTLEGSFGFIANFCHYISCTTPNEEITKNLDDYKGPQSQGLFGNVERGTEFLRETNPGKEELREKYNDFQNVNVQDNMFMSAANLCIPGILKNLEQNRQIHCQYALCLVQDVPNGIPVQACDEMLEYASCRYWGGQFVDLFKLIIGQFTPILAMMDKFKQLISDPIGMTLALGKYAACNSFCAGQATGTIGPTCSAATSVQLLAKFVSIFTGIDASFEQYKDSGIDYCEELEDVQEVLNEETIDA